jgi:hypothetical protein
MLFSNKLTLTRHEMYVFLNTEARSRNNCCRGKAINITYVCECVRVRACVRFLERLGVGVGACVLACAYARVTLLIQHAMRSHIAICGLSGTQHIFSTLSHKRHDFRKTGHKMCVLIFSTTFIWNIYLSKKNSATYYHKCRNVSV